jgi:hypothetical protein
MGIDTEKIQGWLPRLLTRILRHNFIVNCDRDVYLRRWYVIRSERVGLFIHQFVRSDEDRALHDHPWDFVVIPIWRGYIEHSERKEICWQCGNKAVPDYNCPICHKSGQLTQIIKQRILPIISTRWRPATFRHRVELLKGDVFTKTSRALSSRITAYTYGNKEKPAWSIFIRFKKIRVWGFWENGFIAWNKWWQEKCE